MTTEITEPEPEAEATASLPADRLILTNGTRIEAPRRKPKRDAATHTVKVTITEIPVAATNGDRLSHHVLYRIYIEAGGGEGDYEKILRTPDEVKLALFFIEAGAFPNYIEVEPAKWTKD